MTRKKRNPWLATLASIIQPGMGQIYNGRLKLGIGIGLLFSVLLPTLFTQPGILTYIIPKTSVALAFFFAIAVYTFAAVNSFKCARQLKDYIMKPFNRWWVYLALYIAVVFLREILLVAPMGLKSYSQTNQAMLPTLHTSDQLMARVKEACVDCPDPITRGELWTFTIPDQPEKVYLMRVVGLPGDRIKLKNSILNINGEVVEAESCSFKSTSGWFHSTDFSGYTCRQGRLDGTTYRIMLADRPLIGSFEAQVPKGDVFVLVDNRDRSIDSRTVGTIPIDHLIAKFEFVYFSPDFSRIFNDKIQ